VLLVAYSGLVQVAAGKEDALPVRWLLGTTAARSIETQARSIRVPPLGDARRLERGLLVYQEACVACHGAPGIAPTEVGRGLDPAPPDLQRTLRYSEGDAARLFWIVKNGIRMTGMPAFAGSRSDEELWGVVALVLQLPRLSGEQYAARLRQAQAEAR
jgi:mono/diheme cytochrome c family protein